jgi:hypothetical protein
LRAFAGVTGNLTGPKPSTSRLKSPVFAVSSTLKQHSRDENQGNAVPGQLLIQGLLAEVGGAADGAEGNCG